MFGARRGFGTGWGAHRQGLEAREFCQQISLFVCDTWRVRAPRHSDWALPRPAPPHGRPPMINAAEGPPAGRRDRSIGCDSMGPLLGGPAVASRRLHLHRERTGRRAVACQAQQQQKCCCRCYCCPQLRLATSPEAPTGSRADLIYSLRYGLARVPDAHRIGPAATWHGRPLGPDEERARAQLGNQF